MTDYFHHHTALVESEHIGEGSRIWAYTHILKEAVIGKHCNIGDHCFIESGVSIGDNVTIKNNTSVWEGVSIRQNVFIGPNVVFTNDPRPRSPRMPVAADRYTRKETWLRPTFIEQGASIGANAIILCGLTIGAYAMVGAGALVTRDIPAYALVYGSPARIRGYVCQCGAPLVFHHANAVCASCGRGYAQHNSEVTCTQVPGKTL